VVGGCVQVTDCVQDSSDNQTPLMSLGFQFMRHDAWADGLFIHFLAEPDAVQSRLPEGLTVDNFDGSAVLSIVLVSEVGIGPTLPFGLFALLGALKVSHDAVNVRTYVKHGSGPPGIFFFTLECSSLLPALGARLLFGLPYRFADMSRQQAPTSKLESHRRSHTVLAREPHASIVVQWHGVGPTEPGRAGSLEAFVVERYHLYAEPSVPMRLLSWALRWREPSLWRGTITHEPWPMQAAEVVVGQNTMLEAVGFGGVGATRYAGAHCTAGVGPIEFFWGGFLDKGEGTSGS